jgi:hypothetical protein
MATDYKNNGKYFSPVYDVWINDSIFRRTEKTVHYLYSLKKR